MLSTPLGKTFALVLGVIVVSVAMIVLDGRGLLDPVKRPVQAVMAPVTGLFNDVARTAGGGTDEEMAALIAERDYYRAEAMRLQNAETENTQLREQLDIEQKYQDYEVIPAAVLARDPSNSQKYLTIDKGSDDGVVVGQAVVDPNNYVGQVTEVSPTQARVTLLIDTQATPLSVEIVDGGDGLLYGMWQAGGRAEMRYVDFDADPQVGDAVLTSSDGVTQSRGVPGGLLIGTVGPGTVSDALSDVLTVPVIPNADFDQLEVVTVILGPKPETGAGGGPAPSASAPETPASEQGVPADDPANDPVASDEAAASVATGSVGGDGGDGGAPASGDAPSPPDDGTGGTGGDAPSPQPSDLPPPAG